MQRRSRVEPAAVLALGVLLLACEGEEPLPTAFQPRASDPAAAVSLWPVPAVGGPTPPAPILAASMAGAAGTPPPARFELFDPDEVYMVGIVSPTEDTCVRKTIAQMRFPNLGIVGFNCSANSQSFAIRATDGRVLYGGPGAAQVHVFHCDDCYAFWSADREYPDPTANDERIATPACGASTVTGLLVGPDGRLVTECSPHRWYTDESWDFEYLYALGPNRTALAKDGIVDLVTFPFETTPLVGLPEPDPERPGVREMFTARAREDGYWVVFQELMSRQCELWRVALDGQATFEGRYPALPEHVRFQEQADVKLDGEGRLVQIARKADDPRYHVIVRRSLAGESEIVYDESSNPVVKLSIRGVLRGGLVTGP